MVVIFGLVGAFEGQGVDFVVTGEAFGDAGHCFLVKGGWIIFVILFFCVKWGDTIECDFVFVVVCNSRLFVGKDN